MIFMQKLFFYNHAQTDILKSILTNTMMKPQWSFFCKLHHNNYIRHNNETKTRNIDEYLIKYNTEKFGLK